MLAKRIRFGLFFLLPYVVTSCGSHDDIAVEFDSAELKKTAASALVAVIRENPDGGVKVIYSSNITRIDKLSLENIQLAGVDTDEIVLLTFLPPIDDVSPTFLAEGVISTGLSQIHPISILHEPLQSQKPLEALEPKDPRADLITKFSAMVHIDNAIFHTFIDIDSDGFESPEDCDDQDSAIHPGGVEINDHKDNNCDGEIDELNQLPIVGVSSDVTEGVVPLVAMFHCVASDPDPSAAPAPFTYSWDFGDGTTIGDGNADESHTFSIPGNFEPTCMVRDEFGAEGSSFVSEYVYPLSSYEMEGESFSIVDSSKMEVISDPLASGGMTLRVKDTFPNNPPATGTTEASFTVNVGYPGDYYLWVRLESFDAGSDSIYVEMNNENFFMIVPGPYNQYVWFKVGNPQNPGSYVHSLLAGLNTIYLGHREWKVQIDKVILTNDLTFVPAGME